MQYVVPWADVGQSPNDITIGSAVFAGFTNVTNRQTNRHTRIGISRYSACSSRPHLAIAAMRPYNNKWAKNFDKTLHRRRWNFHGKS